MPAVGINHLKLAGGRGGRIPRKISYNWNRACFSGFWSNDESNWNAIAVTFQFRESHLEIMLDLLNLYGFLDCTIVEGKKHVIDVGNGWGTSNIRPAKRGEKHDLVDYSFVFRQGKDQDADFFRIAIVALGVQMRFLSFKEGPASRYRELIDSIADEYLSTKNRTERSLHEMTLRLNEEVFIEGGSGGHAISTVMNKPWHQDLEFISNESILNDIAVKGLKTVSISRIISAARALGGA